MPKLKGVFVTGIGTDVGKTVACAVIVKALDADYWKPIQAGELENSDRIKIKELTNNDKKSIFHPEQFSLTQSLSPHAAAKIDKVNIELARFALPNTDNFLVVEGAGGLMVPINDKNTVADLARHLKLPVVVVSKNYLGSINHTLLTLEALRIRDIPIVGILFNGHSTPESENVITRMTHVKSLGRITEGAHVTPQFIEEQAALLKEGLRNELIRA